MPIELDRGLDDPIFGPKGRPDFEGRLEAATAVVLEHGRQARLAADRLDAEIRDHLATYVVGRSTIHGFAAWFASVEPIAVAGANPAARVLADMIRSRLADHADRRIDEAELKRNLAPHAFLQVERDPAVVQVWTTSAGRTVRSPLVAVPM
jgi:hypothetical protein